MSLSNNIRVAYITALIGLSVDGVDIPVFDEIVNPSVPTPNVRGSQGVYVVIQDQQEYDNAIQNACNYRRNANITVRVVTKWNTVGSKTLCEEIAADIDSRIRQGRDSHNLNIGGGFDLQKIELELTRTITETSQTNIAFSKVLIYNNTVNN